VIHTIKQALQERLDETAHAALREPAGRDAFAYGMAIGRYAGLRDALDQIERILADMEEDEERGRSRVYDPRDSFISD
jgi:hypothetical protein